MPLNLVQILNDAVSFGLHSTLFVLYSPSSHRGDVAPRKILAAGSRGRAGSRGVTLPLTLALRRPSVPSACKTGPVTFTWLLEEREGALTTSDKIRFLNQQPYKCRERGIINHGIVKVGKGL